MGIAFASFYALPIARPGQGQDAFAYSSSARLAFPHIVYYCAFGSGYASCPC